MPTLRKPRPLEPGSTIAVVAPASAPRDPRAAERGIASLIERGYRVDVARAAFEPFGHLGGTDEDRLEELNGFLRRDDVDALFCVRGGYGTLRLLPRVDYDAMRRHPKLLVGYSDITALQLAFLTCSGVPALSGPMVAVEWGDPDGPSERLFWELARGGVPPSLVGPGGEALVPVRPGTAEGLLVGGNLTLVTRLLGTPYLPDLDGAILFVEEVGEMAYRLDGLLAHLQLAGVLDRLGGLVLGGFTETEPPDDRPMLPVDDVVRHYTERLPIPVASGLVYGHFAAKSTLPIGVRARLEVTDAAATLALLEPVVG